MRMKQRLELFTALANAEQAMRTIQRFTQKYPDDMEEEGISSDSQLTQEGITTAEDSTQLNAQVSAMASRMAALQEIMRNEFVVRKSS